MTSRSQNPAARNHYIPKFYLERWACPVAGTLRRYSSPPRGGLHEKGETPRGTAYEVNLYTFFPDSPLMPQRQPDIVERKFFSLIDSNAATALTKLLDAGPGALDSGEREDWALFLNSLLERHPAQLAERDKVAEARAGEITDEFRHRARDPLAQRNADRTLELIDARAMARNAVREHMVNEIRDPKVIKYLTGLNWLLIRLQADFPLVTSDSPLIVNFCKTKEPIYTLSIAVSPTQLFLAHPRSWEMDEELLKLLTLSHNFFVMETAHRFIYSRDPLQDGDRFRWRAAAEHFLATANPQAPP